VPTCLVSPCRSQLVQPGTCLPFPGGSIAAQPWETKSFKVVLNLKHIMIRSFEIRDAGRSASQHEPGESSGLAAFTGERGFAHACQARPALDLFLHNPLDLDLDRRPARQVWVWVIIIFLLLSLTCHVNSLLRTWCQSNSPPGDPALFFLFFFFFLCTEYAIIDVDMSTATSGMTNPPRDLNQRGSLGVCADGKMSSGT
jgi:hypothetical protein